jgi:hypothetical protein
MEATIRDGLQVARDSHGLLESERQTLPPGVGKQVDELKATVDEASDAARQQEAHTAGFSDTSEKAQALKYGVLVTSIHPIITFVRLGSSEDAELRRTLTIGKVKTYEDVIVVGTNLADYFDANKARFVAAGFAEDTGALMRSAVKTLQDTLAEKSEHYRRRREATVALSESYRRMRKLIRFIDRLLRSAWARSPEKLAGWRTASKFTRTRNGNALGGGTVPATPAPGANTVPDRRVV